MIHLIGTAYVPYPSWLNPADNTWQITAATFVGLMSIPGLAVLYASIVPKKWAVNVLSMMFAGFSLVLVAWVLWEYKMGFGATSVGGGVKSSADWSPRPRTRERRGPGSTSSRTSSGSQAGSPTALVNRAKRCRRPTPSSPSTSRRRRWRTSSSSSPPSPRCCSWGACSDGSSSSPGACWCRCGRPASTASTRSCCGAVATSPRRERWTSPVGTSSTCRPVCPASSQPGCSARGSYETDSTPCPTTW